MTIYNIQVISSTGFPYYNKFIKELPKGIKLYLRFFDFTQNLGNQEDLDQSSSFELTAGLISALFEFSKSLDKRIKMLEFKSKKDSHNAASIGPRTKYTGDVLITTQTETYLFHKSVREKVRLIYENIIKPKIPVESAPNLSDQEEELIERILADRDARDHLSKKLPQLRAEADKFLDGMGSYGLEGICIMSFDLSPIITFGDKYSFKDIEIILRNIGGIPQIDPLEWKYRQSFFEDASVWVYVINSGIGVTVEGLFEPFFYVLMTDPQSYMGEFPSKLTQSFNLILD